jgi:leader peptidase (prepilin peptidase)/N-methyltransferase
LTPGDPPAWFFPVVVTCLGLIVGSFANVCIYRLPLGRSIVCPGSACPSCQRPIRALDNIPVLSFLFLGARCRSCRAPISWRYPLVEATNGLLWLGIALAFGETWTALFLMILVTALLVLSLIDLDHQILPDVITLPGTLLALLASVVGVSGVPFPAALEGTLGGYLAFWSVASLYRRTRGVDGLGEGDWKMAALLGAALGWRGLLLVVLFASLAGTLVGVGLIVLGGRTAQHRLPFGTFLGGAGIAAAFAGPQLLAWYAGLFSG